MQNSKKAFSFVELIITISIIVLLAVVWLSMNQWHRDKTSNTKIVTDIDTLNNALESYTQENGSLPMPWWNTNFFTRDWSYAHSFSWAETFGVYGNITEDTIPKWYLNILPLDPRTNSYYSYWKTKGTAEIVANQFETAWVQIINWTFQAKVAGNYTAEVWPYNLIREYNGSNFVYDKSKTNLPYNPEELIITATAEWVVYREWDVIKATNGDLEIYFSDGSVSVLEDGGELTLSKLSFPKDNNLNTLIKLSLWAWTIWTKATNLDEESEFEIYTTDSTAAVRWTIFSVTKDTVLDRTQINVIDWTIEVYEKVEEEEIIENVLVVEEVKKIITAWEKIVIENDEPIEETNTLILDEVEKEIFIEKLDEAFEVYEDIRDDETLANVEIEYIEQVELQSTGTTDEETQDTSTDTPVIEEPTCNDNEKFSTSLDKCVTNLIELNDYDSDWLRWKQIWNEYREEYVNFSVLSCKVWDLIWNYDSNEGKCIYSENDITPWTQKTVNLDGAFDIELTVADIPSTKQYLLYWGDEFKVFFDNFDITNNRHEVCFQKWNETPICKHIWSDNKIIISKDSSGLISLNWSSTNITVTWTIDLFKIWYFPLWDNKVWLMDENNLINLKIIQ